MQGAPATDGSTSSSAAAVVEDDAPRPDGNTAATATGLTEADGSGATNSGVPASAAEGGSTP